VAVPLDSAGAADVADAQTAANALEETLEQLGSARREEVRRVERVDAIARAVLLPLALLSAVLVFVGGGRTIRLAREAERDRQALRHAVDALQEAVRTKAGLMRGVTHDLKNPLGAALGYADLLTDGVVGSLSEEQRRIVARIHHLVHVSLDTIRDLLDLARADAEELRVEPVPTDLAELVRDTAADYAASAAQAGLAIAVDVPTTEVVAATDPARVRQILGNLLSNAIKYGKGGGQVSLSLSRMSAPDSSGTAGVAIAVRDGGPGIASEYRERIFEEFFRVPERSGAADGAGVGLAISRRMARLLGGDLRLTSSDGSGSTFVLWVPEGPGTRD
jgi:signal transduction histidine kinase